LHVTFDDGLRRPAGLLAPDQHDLRAELDADARGLPSRT
jgi:hypothetical protein